MAGGVEKRRPAGRIHFPRGAFRMSRIAFLLVIFAGCAKASESPAPVETATPQAAEAVTPLAASPLESGVAYLIKQQSPDGAWRSDLYATFKDGPALTPLVVVALQEVNEPEASATGKAARKGSDYLASFVNADGSIKGGNGDIDYPVYTAALSVIVLSHPDNKDLLKARDAWLKYLLDRQLTEKLDWKPDDKQYGGWSYC